MQHFAHSFAESNYLTQNPSGLAVVAYMTAGVARRNLQPSGERLALVGYTVVVAQESAEPQNTEVGRGQRSGQPS